MQPIFHFSGLYINYSIIVGTRKNNGLSEKDLAKYIITSKESAEVFIKRWIHRHRSSREKAVERLRELGIQLNLLPDKQ